MSTALDWIVARVWQVADRPNYVFADYQAVFEDWDGAAVRSLFHDILREIQRTEKEAEPPFGDQLHLMREADFNLTLKVVGRREEQAETLTASEFDMLLFNITGQPISVPVYRTSVDRDRLYDRPQRLGKPDLVEIGPYRAQAFSAYAELVELASANREVPALVAHSAAVGKVSWVFDRTTGEPIGLTDNHLQSSRMRMAVRILGEIGQEVHVETLERLARSDYLHTVRWESARSAYALSPKRGTEMVAKLLDDPHPSIRRAARATLDNIRDAST